MIRNSAGAAAAVLSGLVLITGCGGSESWTGAYSLSVTYQENTCILPNWTNGFMANNVAVAIADNSGRLVASFPNDAANMKSLLSVYADHINSGAAPANFEGSASDEVCNIKIIGSKPFMLGSCTYTISADLSARRDNAFVTGSIIYKAATNGSSSCGELTNCTSTIAFNATRPPR